MQQPTAPGNDLGEILESGQATMQPKPQAQKNDLGGLDWLEKMTPQMKTNPQKPDDNEEQKKKQLKRMKKLDDKESRERYQAIQDEIELFRKKRDSKPRQYISGATGFEADPEVRQKKILEQQKKAGQDDLSAAVKASMGTGEATRGAVG